MAAFSLSREWVWVIYTLVTLSSRHTPPAYRDGMVASEFALPTWLTGLQFPVTPITASCIPS